MKIGQKFMGTDGQCYIVKDVHPEVDFGYLMVVGNNVVIPFSPKTLKVYDLYGSPQKKGVLTLVKGSEKKATALWAAKERILNKFLEDLKSWTPAESYADKLLKSEQPSLGSTSLEQVVKSMRKANKKFLDKHSELKDIIDTEKKQTNAKKKKAPTPKKKRKYEHPDSIELAGR